MLIEVDIAARHDAIKYATIIAELTGNLHSSKEILDFAKAIADFILIGEIS